MGSMFSSSSSQEQNSSSGLSSLMPGSSPQPQQSGLNTGFSIGGRKRKSKGNKKTNHKTKRKRR